MTNKDIFKQYRAMGNRAEFMLYVTGILGKDFAADKTGLGLCVNAGKSGCICKGFYERGNFMQRNPRWIHWKRM